MSQSEVEVREPFGTVLERWDSAECLMGSMAVIAVQPVSRHVTHLVQVIEHVVAKNLGEVRLVESFDIGVLRGFSKLDEVVAKATLKISNGTRTIY